MGNENGAAIMQQRMENLNKVYNFEKTDRVMTKTNLAYWNVFDAGFTAKECVEDLSKAFEANKIFHERYNYDIYNTAVAAIALLHFQEPCGPRFMFLDGEKENNVVVDHSVMTADEYGEATENLDRFYWTKMLPRALDADVTSAKFAQSIRKNLELAGIMKQCGMWFGQVGALAPHRFGCDVGSERLGQHLRGMKEFSTDLRRRPEKIIEFSDMFYEREVASSYAAAKAIGSVSPGFTAMYGTCLLVHSFMNSKQFEKLYWPYMKKNIDFLTENGMHAEYYVEADILRFADIIEDIPKGLGLFHLEQDNVFEFRKRLPNQVVAGGMSTSLLANGTPEECVELCKRLINEMGPGYIYSEDKMLCTARDAKRENMLACMDYIKNGEY